MIVDVIRAALSARYASPEWATFFEVSNETGFGKSRAADAIAIHHRHSIEVNPLYKRGHNRVGCFPCIMANKEEIRLIAEQAPERFDLIRELEAEFTAERARRNESGEGDFKHANATFFQAKDAFGSRGIDDIVAWSKTARGGKQLPLLASSPDGGCFRWGLCEPPTDKEDGT